MRGAALVTCAVLGLTALVAGVVGCGDGDDAPDDRGLAQVRLVFPVSTTTDIAFVEVTREEAGDGGPRRAMDLLIAGPTQAEMDELRVFNAIPGGTRVNSLGVEAGTATVDFSGEILGFGGGSASVLAITGSIERTLLAQPGVTSVVILVDGKPYAIQP